MAHMYILILNLLVQRALDMEACPTKIILDEVSTFGVKTLFI